MPQHFTGVKWAPSSTLLEPGCCWGKSMPCLVTASLQCTTPAPRSPMSPRKIARNGSLHSRMQFSLMQRQRQRTLKSIRATMHWRGRWARLCQTLRSVRYLRRRFVMFQRRQRRDKTSPRRRPKGVTRDAERWLLLWCNPLRNRGPALPPDELSLLNLPSNYGRTVRSLVQRASIRLRARPGRIYSVQVNAEGDAQFLFSLWHAAHFRA